jgi:L-Ala-D/L-Glu epimerase
MIKNIEIFPTLLPLKSDFQIAGGVVANKKKGAPHVFVKISDDTQNFGWGECRPSHRWSYETLETVTTTLKKYIAPEISGMDENNIEDIHKQMNCVIANGIVTGQPIAKSAIDMALYDLNSKKATLSLQKFLDSSEQKEIKLSAIISEKNPEKAVKQAENAIKDGFTGFKIKAGINIDHDLEIIKSVSDISKNIFIVVDANQSWDIEKTIKMSKLLAATNVKYIEQPLHANDILGYAQIVNKCELPIALDESIFTAQDLINHIKLYAIKALVLKVSRSAGIYNAYNIGKIALDNGITLLGGGLTESPLGLLASAHLFAALGIKTPVDLNGMQFLSDKIFKGKQTITYTSVNLNDIPGIGVEENFMNSLIIDNKIKI